MANPVVHFEITGKDPQKLKAYYSQLFGWKSKNAPVAEAVSDAASYGFIDRISSGGGSGIPGGIGGGDGYSSHAVFYVGVDDVEEALQTAEKLGGMRIMGPAKNVDGGVVVGHFTDPEGNLVGVAGPK